MLFVSNGSPSPTLDLANVCLLYIRFSFFVNILVPCIKNRIKQYPVFAVFAERTANY